MIILGRTFNQRERKIFQGKKNEENILHVFSKVLRVFHDGIVLIQDDTIIYENDFIQEIFNLNKG